jgi:hypothetical protein
MVFEQITYRVKELVGPEAPLTSSESSRPGLPNRNEA